MTWTWSSDTLGDLAGFLEERDILHGPVTATRIGDGHSNLTFLVDDGSEQVIVRRPPPPPTPPGAHDMLREARLISALRGSSVPVAEVLATAEAGEVLDVPLYVMTHVPGVVITDTTPEPLANPDDRRCIGEELVTVLATLHGVDWRGVGLADFGRPEGFNTRHVQRMGRLIADQDGAAPAAFAPLCDWLAEHAPAESGESIIHLDYRLGNVIVGAKQPAHIAAVLDWELATVGDPLVDFAAFLSSYPVAGRELTPTEELGRALLEPGYPIRDEIITMYADATGRSLSNLPWYEAMAQWKLAVLYEYGRRRAVAGKGDAYYADPQLVASFLSAAYRCADLSMPAISFHPL